MTDFSENQASVSTRCALFTPYPNRHLTELFQSAAQMGGWDFDVYYYSELPAHRKQLGWAIPENCFKIGWGIGSANLPRLLKSYNQIIFLGIADPPVFQLLSAAYAVYKKKRVIIASEGRKQSRVPVKSKNLRRRLTDYVYRIGLSAINHKRVSILAIGDGSAEDYQMMGVIQPSYYRFGFAEKSPVFSVPTKQKQKDSLTILSIGQLIPRKNHIAVCKALHGFRGDSKVNYVICGSGSEEDNLRAEAKLFPSNCKLILAGTCSDSQLTHWLGLADIFVMPSLYDGWGVALNHAIQASLPVVVSRNTRSGPGHLVTNEVNGFIYNSEKELSDRLFMLLEDSSLRNQMSFESQRIAKLWFFDEIASRLDLFIRGDLALGDDGGPLAMLEINPPPS